jgi:hypothetical protein
MRTRPPKPQGASPCGRPPAAAVPVQNTSAIDELVERLSQPEQQGGGKGCDGR